MALTPDELKQLREALTNGILEGMGKIPQYYNGKNIGDPNAADYDKDARQLFLKNLTNQSKDDKWHEIQRQIESINGNTKLGAKKIEELKEEQERLLNGGISKNDEKKYQAQRIATIANSIATIGKGIIDFVVAFGERDIALRRAYLERESKIIQIGIERESKITSQGTKAIVSGFSKNAVDMAYEATQFGYDLTKTSAKTAMDLKIAEKTYAKNVKEANLQFSTSLIASGVAIGATIGTAIGGPVGTAVGAIIGAAGGLIGHAISKFGGLTIKEMQLEIQKQEAISNAMQAYLEQMESFAKPWDELHKQTTDFVLKINDAGLKFGATIGYTGDKFGDTFANTMISMSQQTLANGSNLAKMFGKEAEKIPEYMDSYISASNRAVGMNANDIGNMMATGRLFGMSGQESAGLYGAMNVFNTSISSASDSMGVMYHQITRMGLSSKKFGKDLVQNLKMAEKYNFKGGVDNMMKLTKWAQQTRFNLNSAASFADSIMNDSLSGALEKAAKLQVLGGSAAIYSDPLGMLYDAGADVGNMAQRMAAMFNDITGTFNRKTGETDFNWYENRMIAARAQALGMDVGEAKNMIRQNNKQGVINRVLRGSGLDKEDKLAIGNRATYNKKKGIWEVTDIHGETHDIREYGKEGGPDINDLLPAETEEAILTVAEKSLTHLERLDHAFVDRYMRMGNEKKGTVLKTADEQRYQIDKYFQENWGNINTLWDYSNEYSKQMLTMQIKMMKIASDNPELLQNVYTAMAKASYDFILAEDKLKDFTGAVNAAKESLDELAIWVGERFPDTEGPMEKIKEQSKRQVEGAKDAKWYDKLGAGLQFASGIIAGGGVTSTLMSMGLTNLWQKLIKNGTKTEDGIINTNGSGVILNPKNVTSIHDGAVRTSENDQYLAAETGGPIDILIKQILPGLMMLLGGGKDSNSNNVNVNFSGGVDFKLNGEPYNVDLINQAFRNNPSAFMETLALIGKGSGINANGKPVYKINYT